MTASTAFSSMRQYLLGAFVCFQLVAIPLGSYIKLVPVRIPEPQGELSGDLQERLSDDKWTDAREPLQTIFDCIALTTARWTEMSGQMQSWALFASFGKQAALPVVELHWPDELQLPAASIRTYFEPTDPTNYFYPPERCCRLYNYEYRTCFFYWIATPDQIDDQQLYRKRVMKTVEDMQRSLQAYMRWRMNKYLNEHPEAPKPDRIILKARILPLPSVDSPRLRPPTYEIPLAQWRPDRVNELGQSQIEVWDPLAASFAPLSVRRAP